MTSLPWVIRVVLLLAPLTGCVGIGGEEMDASGDPLTRPSQQYSDRLLVQKSAEDLRAEKDRISGAKTTGLGAAGNIETISPTEQRVMERIQDALTSIGYHVDIADGGTTGRPAVRPLELKAAINELRFKNFNWIWPLVLTWGDIKLTLYLEDARGETRFKKSYGGGGNSYCLTDQCAIQNATNEAMTEVLNQIIQDFSSQPVKYLIRAEYQEVSIPRRVQE